MITNYPFGFSGGLSVRGIPIVTSAPNQVFWVSSGIGSNGNNGKTREKPFATLDYAIGKCTASKGDIIFLLPGHAESKTTTGDIATLDVAGVTIIGMGNGSLKPTFTFGHAGTTMTISGANCRLVGIKIISDVADCAVGITASATADGLSVIGCDFYDGALTKELVIGISIAAACHEVSIIQNRFIVNDGDGGGCANAIKAVGASDYAFIQGNYVQGNFTSYPIDFTTAASVGIVIDGNSVFNTDTANGYGVACHASTTGHVVRNLITNAKDTVAPVTAAACNVSQNYGSNAAGASGIIKPTVDS
jgi:hypothetical protein